MPDADGELYDGMSETFVAAGLTYYLVWEAEKSYELAEEKCQCLGSNGHLAKIYTPELLGAVE